METVNKEGCGLCCRSCRFSNVIFHEKLECRRRAPIIGKKYEVNEFGVTIGYRVPEWPIVEDYYWCGEYESQRKNETK